MIPRHIKSEIESTLNEEILSTNNQSGGDINSAAIINFEHGYSCFLKWNGSAPERMFETEAKGLALLSDADTELIIPEVLLTGRDFLLLSFIESGTEHSDSSFKFGAELAKLLIILA